MGEESPIPSFSEWVRERKKVVLVKPDKGKVSPLVRILLQEGSQLKEQYGVFIEGKLYPIRKRRLFGFQIEPSTFYYVKREHLFLSKVKRRYYLTVIVDPKTRTSIGLDSQAPAWTREEIDQATKVVANWLISHQLEERLRELARERRMLMYLMVAMFFGILVFAGVLYWHYTNSIEEISKNIITQIFPAPGGGG